MKNEKSIKGFSIIIPVRNKESHLSRCLHSVLRQSFRKFEVLIIDDSSSDGSLAIAKLYEKSDERIHVFQRTTPGPGGYAARNLGLQNARYNWCAFLDADDEWREDHLAIADKLVQWHPEIVMVTSSWLIDNGTSQALDKYSKCTDTETPTRLTLDDYLKGPRPIWTGVVRGNTSFLKRVGFFNERWRHGADIEYWFRLFLEGEGDILWTPEPSAIYHTDSDNMVTSNTSQVSSPSSEFIHGLLEKETVEEHKAKKLKKYANRSQILPFIRKIALGCPTSSYIRKHFFTRELTIQQRMFIGILMLMPKRFASIAAKRILDRHAHKN